MKIPNIAWAIILSIGIVITIYGAWVTTHPPTTDIYKGKIALWTEEEYVEFKKAVAPTEVQIIDLDILSSEPPIIIQFKVIVEKGFEFPYGKVAAKAGVTQDDSWMLYVGIPPLSYAIGLAATRRVDWD